MENEGGMLDFEYKKLRVDNILLLCSLSSNISDLKVAQLSFSIDCKFKIPNKKLLKQIFRY